MHIFSTVLRNMIGAVPTGRKRNIDLMKRKISKVKQATNSNKHTQHTKSHSSDVQERQIMWGLSILV